MYQTRYLVDKYGLPKFHIFECETIRNFLDKGVFDQYYSFSTANTNDIIERKTGKEFKMYLYLYVDIVGICYITCKRKNFSVKIWLE